MRTLFLSICLYLLGFSCIAQEKELPNIVANNVITLEGKYGKQSEAFRAFQISYERFLFRSSLLSAHGLKVAYGRYAWNNIDLMDYRCKMDLMLTSYLGAFRHFLVLELGYSLHPDQPEISIYPREKHRFIINAGYKYHRLKPGLFYTITAGTNANINLGVGYTF